MTFRKNIEIMFKPNERLFDLTHKTPIKSISLCVWPHALFMGKDIQNGLSSPKSGSYKNECMLTL